MRDFSINKPEQRKRADAGRQLVKKIKVNGACGTFQGSGKNPYRITLNECSCGDYIRRHEPCKHMFALAYKLKTI